ncbi:hypothetical protein AB0N28_07070 [Streptomyces sp. NPDC051130]|uniref:hypothetical protein n=1 Tax=Streptomyces sp. NPDC051130 TaxID=3157223 RepID=UPI0034431B95
MSTPKDPAAYTSAPLLWQGVDPPAAATAPPPPADWPQDDDVWAAWEAICVGVPAAEVRAAVAADLRALNQQEDAPTSAARPTAVWTPVEPATDSPHITHAAGEVGTAMATVDAHAAGLEHHPEWQRIQTVRGALRHVWDVMKEKAGPAWDTLRADIRFQGFWRTASIRFCEAVSVHAAGLANRLRPGTGDLPAADALMKLSDTLLTYSTVAEAQPATAPTRVPDVGEVPMRRLAERTAPTAYATREDAARAAAEVTAHFRTWIAGPMGQELAGSDHSRVKAFRDAWQQLPPHDSGMSPAVGQYSDVAERAKALVTAAIGSGRFTPGDLQALQAVAQAADQHAARLAVTLPPGAARPAPNTAAPAPAVAVPMQAPPRTPRVSA